MRLLAHRGLWEYPEQKNTTEAFVRALEEGFGIETDVRDLQGELVVSHDAALSGCLEFSEFLSTVRRINPKAPLAINIKADGLQRAFQKSSIESFDHFYFDMSVPDALLYSKRTMRFYTRYSDIEPYACLLSESQGVWIDNFNSNAIDLEAIRSFLVQGKRVALVSPELHGFPYQQYWVDLKLFISSNIEYSKQIDLCTDHPIQAKEFFDE